MKHKYIAIKLTPEEQELQDLMDKMCNEIYSQLGISIDKDMHEPLTLKEYCEQRASSGDPVTVNELKRKFNIQ